ncbi:DNA repair protein RecO [Granulicella tundricola]|uniref:DNA repair protein RecO n=1 Tax=Granulicella tundricola (strain ATCC BAA-1859 / DSM 23138 / MP5ACTX9) TaxID=1198114 RepID=E8WWI6_GRATM|nr:DNA repair protein RecO [Granulicella tundricola]ADW69650.1 DNA repair protein RecO [Granulicella tundricola MP5ACTX9]
MKEGRIAVRVGEAIVLRTWPFHEADLLVSLFTREFGKVKGIARHAMRSRRRFGGALEPMTHVKATWAERPKQELVRLDAFEIMSSPMTAKIDFVRLAGLELVAEVLDELPDGAVEDAVFRLALAVTGAMEVGRVWMPVTYFCLWMTRLMGWMPELGRCVVCGEDLRGRTVWYSGVADGVTCADDRRPGSVGLGAEAVAEALRMFKGTVQDLGAEEWPKERGVALRRFAVETLERHLEKRLVSARALAR